MIYIWKYWDLSIFFQKCWMLLHSLQDQSNETAPPHPRPPPVPFIIAQPTKARPKDTLPFIFLFFIIPNAQRISLPPAPTPLCSYQRWSFPLTPLTCSPALWPSLLPGLYPRLHLTFHPFHRQPSPSPSIHHASPFQLPANPCGRQGLYIHAAIATPHHANLTWKCPWQPPKPSPSFPAT